MIQDVLTHPVFVSVFFTWVIAGLIKALTAAVSEGRRTLAEHLFSTGGMPSGHSGVVTAMTVSVLLLEGWSTLFFCRAVFSLLIIRDSFGVRWSVGEQARVLNDLVRHDHLHEKVKVVLGHTFAQAVAGMALGAVIALGVHALA